MGPGKNSIVPINFYPNQPTIIAGVRGTGANSSEPLPPLTGLTQEEAKCAVLSNYLVVPRVTINTIIWQNWDIFISLESSPKQAGKREIVYRYKYCTAVWAMFFV